MSKTINLSINCKINEKSVIIPGKLDEPINVNLNDHVILAANIVGGNNDQVVYEWQINNVTTSIKQFFVFGTNVPGTYNILLTVKNNNDNKTSDSLSFIIIVEQLGARISYKDSPPSCTPESQITSFCFALYQSAYSDTIISSSYYCSPTATAVVLQDNYVELSINPYNPNNNYGYAWTVNNIPYSTPQEDANTIFPDSSVLGQLICTVTISNGSIPPPTCTIILQIQPVSIAGIKVNNGSPSDLACGDIFQIESGDKPTLTALPDVPAEFLSGLMYQWYLDKITNPIDGATNQVYTITQTNGFPHTYLVSALYNSMQTAFCSIRITLKSEMTSNLAVGIYVLVNNRLENFVCGNTINVKRCDIVTLIANPSNSDVSYEWITDNTVTPSQAISVDTSIPGTYVYTTRIQSVPAGNTAYCTITVRVDPQYHLSGTRDYLGD
jgi:hypothetical protein